MINLLRAAVVVSLLAMIAAGVLPFDRPLVARYSYDQPPILPILAALLGVLAFSLQVLSAYGLLRLRRWAPPVAAATVILMAGCFGVLMLAPHLASAASTPAKIMALLSAISLALAVWLTKTRELKVQFGVAP